MNKRAIVNVATGEFYCKMQKRLQESFSKCVDKTVWIGNYGVGHTDYSQEKGIDLILWDNLLPSQSRHHDISPYGFKVHAIKAAYEMGYTSILWLDSPAYAVKEDISPIFDKIEKEGYYVMSHIDPLENWVGNKALKYYNGTKREYLIGMNLPSGSCYGFDFSSQIGGSVFYGLCKAEEVGMFESEVIDEGKWHRHDEAILAMELNGRIFTFDPLFQSDSPECVIKSGEQ